MLAASVVNRLVKSISVQLRVLHHKRWFSYFELSPDMRGIRPAVHSARTKGLSALSTVLDRIISHGRLSSRSPQSPRFRRDTSGQSRARPPLGAKMGLDPQANAQNFHIHVQIPGLAARHRLSIACNKSALRREI